MKRGDQSGQWLRNVTDAILSDSLGDEERDAFIFHHVLGLPVKIGAPDYPLVKHSNRAQANRILNFVIGYMRSPPQTKLESSNEAQTMKEVAERIREATRRSREEEKSVLAALVEEGKFSSERAATAKLDEGIKWLKRFRPKNGERRNLFAIAKASYIVLYSPLLSDASDGPPRIDRFTFSGNQYAALLHHIENEEGLLQDAKAVSSLYEKLRGLGPFMEVTDELGATHFFRVADLYLQLFDMWNDNRRRESDVALTEEAAATGDPRSLYRKRVKRLTELLNHPRIG